MASGLQRVENGMAAAGVALLLAVLLEGLAGGQGLEIRLGYSARDLRSAATIHMAVDRIQSEGFLREHNFTVLAKYGVDTPTKGVAAALELLDQKKVAAVFGQTRSAVCEPTGYLYTVRNIPFLPAVCTRSTLADKVTYPTLIRNYAAHNKLANAFTALFRTYQWTRAILFTSDNMICGFGAVGIQDAFRASNLTIAEAIQTSETLSDDDLLEYLKRMQTRGRVILICHSLSVIRRMLLLADQLSMKAGEYVWIYFRHSDTAYTTQPWAYNETGEVVTEDDMQKRRDAYNTYKEVTVAGMPDDKIEEFGNQLRARLLLPPYNMNFTGEARDSEASTCDVAYLYLMLVNETLAEGGDYRNGTLIMQKAKNRVFNGWGGRVAMDNNADRNPDFWLWDVRPERPLAKRVAYIRVLSQTDATVEEIQRPYWGTADNQPPPDTPPCGFYSELCPPDNTAQTAMIVGICCAVAALFIGGIAWMFIQRRRHAEEQLRQMIWKVDFADIQFQRKVTFDKNLQRSQRSLMSDRLGSSVSKQSLGVASLLSHGQQVYTNVGLHKGIYVAVKMADIGAVVLSRNLLLELKTMKEFNHENINPFIGACIDAPNMCTLFGYCAKGSLQDVLENDDIKLDWMFQSSLISDLSNAMIFLHASPLRSHGRLRSSNCLIDSRWSLKVSSYGLGDFRTKSATESDEYKRHRDLLWTAPELLRMPIEERPLYGTLKGDVYSFAIILQELMYRGLPFFGVNQPQDILDLVKKPGAIPFRPKVSKEGFDGGPAQIIDLMTSCWAEDPDDRPHFGDVRRRLRTINQGRKTNILDNMIQMLERYATNLEQIVEQRTGELMEEKKKTDVLLYRMMPRTVAEELKRGLTVVPELYDAVTIYFSDIVGFTNLSSESSPMEVVQLLNDLYTTFDLTIEQHDVYKVETIGDAYMVVSGLPQKNGNRHVTEIANMALALLERVQHFKVHHRPNYSLRLRIGLHTGPCAAGVVGQTMPRYCLFGDTVNMASRMESTGEALKIHISEFTYELARESGLYKLSHRGGIEVKGKGEVQTYWLQGKKPLG